MNPVQAKLTRFQCLPPRVTRERPANCSIEATPGWLARYHHSRGVSSDLSLRRCVAASLRTWRRAKRGVLQRIKTFELSTEHKLRLRDLPSHKVVRVYFPAPFGVTVSKVETLQMRCGFDPHISRVKIVGFALGRHEFQSNDSKSSFRQW